MPYRFPFALAFAKIALDRIRTHKLCGSTGRRRWPAKGRANRRMPSQSSPADNREISSRPTQETRRRLWASVRSASPSLHPPIDEMVRPAQRPVDQREQPPASSNHQPGFPSLRSPRRASRSQNPVLVRLNTVNRPHGRVPCGHCSRSRSGQRFGRRSRAGRFFFQEFTNCGGGSCGRVCRRSRPDTTRLPPAGAGIPAALALGGVVIVDLGKGRDPSGSAALTSTAGSPAPQSPMAEHSGGLSNEKLPVGSNAKSRYARPIRARRHGGPKTTCIDEWNFRLQRAGQGELGSCPACKP